jgi:Mn2+/Fe2+ NRAMP family transporter
MVETSMASSAFHAGHSDVAEIETAYHTLAPLLGIAAAGVFLVSLIASGIQPAFGSSSLSRPRATAISMKSFMADTAQALRVTA